MAGIEIGFLKLTNTLRHPKFIRGDKLETFDCVIATPPFILSEWGYDLWQNAVYGRKQHGLIMVKFQFMNFGQPLL